MLTLAMTGAAAGPTADGEQLLSTVRPMYLSHSSTPSVLVACALPSQESQYTTLPTSVGWPLTLLCALMFHCALRETGAGCEATPGTAARPVVVGLAGCAARGAAEAGWTAAS